jgi:site-specific recombinase XerC
MAMFGDFRCAVTPPSSIEALALSRANPAGSVRGPRHVVTTGQTPVLDPSEARALLDSIDTSTPAGLRDRALIALSFARIGAARRTKTAIHASAQRLDLRAVCAMMGGAQPVGYNEGEYRHNW